MFEKDRSFKRASYLPAGESAITGRDRNAICAVFERRLGLGLDRENGAIADAVGQQFPAQAERLRDVVARLRRLPERDHDPVPHVLSGLEKALEACYRAVRQTEPTVLAVKRHLDALNDGLEQLAAYDAELTDEAARRVREAADADRYQRAQLESVGAMDERLKESAARVQEQLAAERPWRDVDAIEPDLQA